MTNDVPSDNIEQIKEFLKSYKPNSSTVELLKEIPLVIITSPTSTGKDSIINKLLETNKYSDVITDTTRPRRENDGVLEKNGQNYWFRSNEQFLNGLTNGSYVEAAIVHQRYIYGTSIIALQQAVNNGGIPILDIDIMGCNKVHQYNPKIKTIFLLPPSFNEWMRRLNHRGTMHDDEKFIRLNSAANEIGIALESPHFKFFINDDLDLAANQINDYILTNRFDVNSQNSSIYIAKKLLSELLTILKTKS